MKPIRATLHATSALLLAVARLVRGPSLPDRALALDTLYINAIALIILYGIWQGTELFFEIDGDTLALGAVSQAAHGL